MQVELTMDQCIAIRVALVEAIERAKQRVAVRDEDGYWANVRDEAEECLEILRKAGRDAVA